MNWLMLAKQREQELLTELQSLLQIESVLDETQATEGSPFGPGPVAALEWMLARGSEQGMTVKNIDNMAGYIEMGEGDELLGILCHVDVVPAGDASAWTYPPFEGRVVDGKLYARGAIDDKGPTMAAWLAMKMIKDAGIPLKKRVRMIIGTDEESGFRCVERYFAKEEMPTIGFAPDADFPLINAEKGIADLLFTQKQKPVVSEKIISFKAGHRTNMVPDLATAELRGGSVGIGEKFREFLSENKLEGALNLHGDRYIIAVKGKSAHAMEPHKGINAAVYLASFLASEVDGAGFEFVQFMQEVFLGDHTAHYLDLHFTDDMSGETTFNPGIATFDENGASIQVSMRYAVTYPFEEKMTAVQQRMQKTAFTLDIMGNSTPHYVPEEDALVQTLLAVYQEHTGDFSKPLSTGGGTYAREMKKGVAFGMLYPGELDVAHQADEFVVVENLIKAAAIYADAIVRLASK